ncbi:Ubiquitinyl hydrolase 1 [Bertholletia excelsa]
MESLASKNPAIEVLRSIRDLHPAHYLFKIEHFSILLEEDIEKCESDDFEAEGYMWRLSLYPKGNKGRNGDGHISLYLTITDTCHLPPGWEVNAQFRFFIYNHIEDKYLTIEDAKAGTRRFHQMRTERGFAQLLSLDTFNHPLEGYLFDDSCMFGVEVFVIKYAGRGQILSMIREPKNNSFTWTVENFSSLMDDRVYSEVFEVEGQKWSLVLHPKGHGKGRGEYVSIFLSVANHEARPLNWKVYAKYKLRIRCSAFPPVEKVASCWFCSSILSWGFSNFTLLSGLRDTCYCFLPADTLIVEVEIMVMSATKNLP